MKNKIFNSGYILIFTACTMLAVKSVYVKSILNLGFEPLNLLLLRLVFALPFFIILIYFLKGFNGFKITRQECFWLALLGITGFGAAMTLTFYAFKLLGVTLTVIIMFLFPVITVFLARIFFKEPITNPKLISAILSFIGMFIVLKGSANTIDIDPMGYVFAFGSAVTCAFYGILLQKNVATMDPLKVKGYAVFFALIVIAIGNLFVGFEPKGNILQIGFLMGIPFTAIPFILIAQGVKKLGASKSGVISTSEPVMAVILAMIILGESLSPMQVVGIVMVIAGIVSLEFKQTKGNA